AGDWGGRSASDLPTQGGGLEFGAPRPTATALSSVSPSSNATTAVGSVALVETPVGRSPASTAVGSVVLHRTPELAPSGRGCAPSPRRLSFSQEAQGEAADGSTQADDVLDGAAKAPVIEEHNRALLEVVGATGPLSSLCIPHRQEEEEPSGQDLPRTPIVVPLGEHRLIRPSEEDTATEFGPKTVVTTLLEGVGATPAPSVLGLRPVASVPARRKKTLPPNFTPRRSARLCQQDDGMKKGPEQRAQTVLLRRMGLIENKEQMTQEALEAYLRLFDKPLAPQ
uniref:Uncharacterized protein n=1 Tax=Triticum urartu TaxID=4572 RepID=A0A8R7Q6Z2_TRIUA